MNPILDCATQPKYDRTKLTPRTIRMRQTKSWNAMIEQLTKDCGAMWVRSMEREATGTSLDRIISIVD